MKNHGRGLLAERKSKQRIALIAEFFGGLMVGSSVSLFVLAGFISGGIIIH